MNDGTSVRTETSALRRIRNFFEERMYALIDFRLSFEAPIGPSGFPKFEQLQSVVARLDPANCVLFRLFRLGQPVDPGDAKRAIPNDVLDALHEIGLLSRAADGQWRSPDLLLVPIEGLLIFVSTPPGYPTASRPADVWFDLSSYVVAKALCGTCTGSRVLDLCSGSGVQTILCASRGAALSLGLDISARAIEVARMNATLNGVNERTAFRRSDCLAALAPNEKFDLVVCNTPYAPVVGERAGPLAPADIGNAVLFAMIDDIPRCLTESGRGLLAAWRSVGHGGGTYQGDRMAARLAAAGLSVTAFVSRAPDTVGGVLQILKADVEQRYDAARAASLVAEAAALLKSGGSSLDGFYNQLVSFQKGPASDPSANLFGLDLVPAKERSP